jgi:hypothetical protein
MSQRVTEAEVHEAMREIDAEGKKVTAPEIRSRLGRGSFTTITKYMQSYDAEPDDGPDDYPDPPIAAVNVLWRAAYGEAWKLYDIALKQARDRIAELNDTERQLTKALDDMSTMLDATKRQAGDATQLRAMLADCQAQLSASERTNELLRHERAEMLAQLRPPAEKPQKPDKRQQSLLTDPAKPTTRPRRKTPGKPNAPAKPNAETDETASDTRNPSKTEPNA